MTIQRMLALIAEVGIGYFATSLGLLHHLRSDVDPSTRYISEYAVGRHGGLMSSAFVALGVGAGALTAGLARTEADGLRTATGLALLGSFSSAIMVVGIYPTDLSLPGVVRTRTGYIHDVAGLLAFRAIALAMIVLSLRFWNNPRWRGLCLPGFVLALLAGTALVWLRQASRPGIPQRLFIATTLLWLGMVAERLRVVTAQQ